MPALQAKQLSIPNQKEPNPFKKKQKLNTVMIQNNKVLVIFKYLQAKLWLFQSK